MKTVSLKMPEEEVKTLEKIVGVLSEKEAKEIEKVLEERRKGWWKSFPRESPFSLDFG